MLFCRILALAAATCLLAVGDARALDPESPQVQRLIDSGLAYLGKKNGGAERFEPRLGGQCLIGLCFYKKADDPDHPHVVEAVKRCQATCRNDANEIQADIYSTGIALVFLCELDAQKYTTEIEKLVQSLVLRQKTQGGWGYASGGHVASCDTSMTQYAVLGLWAARGNGISVPDRVLTAAANWLVRTQDPSGGWGYQGVDPGDYQRVAQSPLRRSLGAAGLGSSYMCADMLGMRFAPVDRGIEGLPAAFMRVPEKDEGKHRGIEGFDPKRLRQAHLDGNRWLAANFGYQEEAWTYYYMYALERYMSFRELVEGKSPGNAWYDQGVKFLEETQQADGHWQGECGDLVDTALAVLFLIRGTKKTIEKTVGLASLDGVLIGGRGLPSDTSNVQVVGGRIVSSSLAMSIDEMLAILEDPEHESFNSITEFPPDLRIESSDPRARAAQIERLTRLTTSGTPAVRKLAIETLAASGQFDVVPALIAALEDRDESVSLAARDGLRRLSRTFNTFGPPDGATAAEKATAAGEWRKWYATVVPQ